MSKTPSKPGGKRRGAGPKPKPLYERRDQVFSVRLTAADKRLLDDTGARSWARDVLLRSGRKRR